MKPVKCSSGSFSGATDNVETNTDDKINIINNKHKLFDKNCLKIESTGKEPIHKIEKKVPKAEKIMTHSESKRMQSINEMRKGYQQQKSAIKAALSNVDFKPKNKIVFDEITGNSVQPEKHTQEKQMTKNKNIPLFESDEGSGDEIDFKVKTQFEGKKGQKVFYYSHILTKNKVFFSHSLWNYSQNSKMTNVLLWMSVLLKT